MQVEDRGRGGIRLSRNYNPTSISEFTQLMKLPEEFKGSLPTIEELDSKLGKTWSDKIEFMMSNCFCNGWQWASMDPNQLEQPTEQFMTEHLLAAINGAPTKSYRCLTQQSLQGLRRHRREMGHECRLTAH